MSQNLYFSMCISNDWTHQKHCIFMNQVTEHEGVFLDSSLFYWPFAPTPPHTHLLQNYIYLITVTIYLPSWSGSQPGLFYCIIALSIFDLWISIWILELPSNSRCSQHWVSNGPEWNFVQSPCKKFGNRKMFWWRKWTR